MVTRPFTTPNFSRMILATGARQLVVQEALETIVCRAGSYLSSLTPMQIVMSSPLAGAVITTFLAPPARWALALSASVKKPVDSMTISAPRSPQGSLAGSRSASTFSSSPSMLMPPSVRSMSTSPPKRGP